MSARKKVNQSGRARLLAPPHRVLRAPFASIRPTTQNFRRRDGRADRRQIQVLTLTAQCLRRRRGLRRRFWPSAPCNRPPLFNLSPPRRVGSCPTKGGGRACHLSPFTSATPRHAEQRVAAMLTRESECAKAAILRSRCEFHRTRYRAAAGFVTEKSGVSLKFRRMELLPVHAIHSGFTASSISSTSRFARARR